MRLARFCKNCGAVMENEMSFCSKCGMKQPEEGGAAPAGRPGPGPASAPVPPAPPRSYPAGPSYPPAPSVRMGDTGRGAGWIMFLRVLLWIVFGGICLLGLALAMPLFQYSSYGADPMVGLGIIVGSVLIAFTVVAAGMVSLDAAQNIRRCAINSANVLDLLNQRRG